MLYDAMQGALLGGVPVREAHVFVREHPGRDVVRERVAKRKASLGADHDLGAEQTKGALVDRVLVAEFLVRNSR